MMPTGALLRALAVVLLLGLVGAACTSGGTDDLEQLKEEVEQGGNGQGETDATEDVEPPPPADGSRTGRVGIIVQSNSDTWEELLDAPTGDGIVVVFVQPGSPAEGAGLAPGDLITAVDGEPVTNAERGVVVLRSQPGQERVLQVTRPDGGETEVPVTAQDPGDINQLQTYGQLLQERPEDPVLWYLLAQELAGFEQSMDAINQGIELQAEFTEAIEVRANTRWRSAQNPEGELPDDLRQQRRQQAMEDWGLALRLAPRNLLALVHRSEALAQQGEPEEARRDAQRAVSTDESTPEAHFALGLARFAQREYGEALVPARRAIDLNPYNVEYYQLLANTFVRLDRRDDATATIQAIIDLIDDPSQREALLGIVESD